MDEDETCHSKSAVGNKASNEQKPENDVPVINEQTSEDEEEEEEKEESIMDRKLYEAAREGNIDSFLDLAKAADVHKNKIDANQSKGASISSSSKNPVHYLFEKTPAKNNILHLSLLYNQFEFTQTAALEIPQLITEVNVHGNNPLHVAAQTGSVQVVNDLVKFHQVYCGKLKAEGKDVLVQKPWRTKNKEGNTPIHVALIHGKIKVACYLVRLDRRVVRVRNNFKETPLHLAVRHHVDGERDKVEAMMKLVGRNQFVGPRITAFQLETDSMEVVNLLLEKDRSVACWSDDKGLTPLLISATIKPCYWEALVAILQYCPESAEVCDHFGNTLLHLMRISPSCDEVLFKSYALKAIRNMQNHEGDTPAHMAVKYHDIDKIILLIALSSNFSIKNKDGISAAALIEEQSEDFRNTLKEKGESYKSWFREMTTLSHVSREEITALSEMDWNSLKKKMAEWGEPFFQKRCFDRSNILFMFVTKNPARFREDEFEAFISKVLLSSPSFVCETNWLDFDRNCIHLLVERAPNMINRRILKTIRLHFEAFRHEGFINDLCYDPPWRAKDGNGDTPLHLALDPTFWKDEISWFKYIECAKEIIKFDIASSREVAENGEMPLHRLVRVGLPKFLPKDETAKKKLSNQIKYIIQRSQDALRKPDNEGLTPLLRAAKNKDIQFLLHVHCFHPRTLNFRDSRGNTYLHLLADMRLSENESQRFEDVSFSNSAPTVIPERNGDGNTPLHLAFMHNNFELAHNFLNVSMREREVAPYEILRIDLEGRYLEEHPIIFDIAKLDNSDGNTLLHVAVGKIGSPLAQSFIKEVYHSSLEGVLILNNDRNTALHLAILKDDFEFAVFLLGMFESEATFLRQILETGDKDRNTPMHLAILEGKSRFVKLFLDIGEKAECIVHILHMSNIMGHIPLHLAAQVGNLDFADQIFNKFEQRENFVNQILLSTNGDKNTALHLAIANSKSSLAYLFINKALEKNCIQKVLGKCNKRGDSPLHVAIKNRNFPLARKFIECAAIASCINEILAIPNRDKDTPGQLIGSDSHLPCEFESFFWNEPEVVEAMLGVRSLSGVSTKIIKEYTNTIGVIAALFATITFTAAFTVPGGLNSTTGTPLLIEKAAFQVFLVSDIIAMCLSMMVLFFLMWIMTINNERHRVILLDLTVFSLQGAFYTALLTFMSGLYVTVSSVVLWIAFLACVLCSLLIFLMHKRFIIWFIPSFIHIYVWFRRGYSWINKLCRYIVCCGYKGNQKNAERSEMSSHAKKPTGHSEAVVEINHIT